MVACVGCLKALEPNELPCRRCGRWTLNASPGSTTVDRAKIISLDQVEEAAVPRIVTGIHAIDAAWGGGFVPGTTTLLVAPAGCGKSTLMLQLSSTFAKLSGKRAYYLSAEQPATEVRMMTNRLGITNADRINVLREYGTGATLDEALLQQDPPACLVLDSLSAMFSKNDDGQIGAIKSWKKHAVRWQCPAILLLHMQKGGYAAGRYQLFHDCDTVMSLDGLHDPKDMSAYVTAGYPPHLLDGGDVRLLDAVKNRHGPTAKAYYLMMTGQGLVGLPPPSPPAEEQEQEEEQPAKPRPRLALVPPADDEPPPRKRARVKPAPETIEHNGQRLVRKPKKKAAKAKTPKGKKPRPA